MDGLVGRDGVSAGGEHVDASGELIFVSGGGVQEVLQRSTRIRLG
jgi:hypothetical protein